MIELVTTYSLSQVPYITNDALDEYAEAVIRDAVPEALTAPCALDAAWFVEFYLGLDVIYKRLRNDRKILAMTAFNAGPVQIFDEETGEPDAIYVRKGTVIIEPSLALARNIHRHRFTYMHEGAHWLIHRKAFAVDNPCGSVGKFENPYLAAKEGRIDYSRKQSECTDSERIERQADFLASALLMPKPTLRMAYRKFFSFYDEKPRRVIRGKSTLDNCWAIQLPQYVSKIYNVSPRAALIRLEKLGAIVDRPQYGDYC